MWTFMFLWCKVYLQRLRFNSRHLIAFMQTLYSQCINSYVSFGVPCIKPWNSFIKYDINPTATYNQDKWQIPYLRKTKNKFNQCIILLDWSHFLQFGSFWESPFLYAPCILSFILSQWKLGFKSKVSICWIFFITQSFAQHKKSTSIFLVEHAWKIFDAINCFHFVFNAKLLFAPYINQSHLFSLSHHYL